MAWLITVGRSFVTPYSVPGLSKEAVIDSLTRLVKLASPGQWVYGTIGLSVFNDPTVRKKLLDSLAPRNPVMLAIMWGHGMILNTKALELIKVSDNSPDPVGGWYERVPESNYISGALYEGSQLPAWHALTVSEPSKLVTALRSHAQQQLAFGITTVQNMSSTLQGNAASRFFKEADLPIKTRIIPMPAATVKGRSLSEWDNTSKQITPLTYVSGIKYMIDGTSSEQAALMTKPYAGRNGWYGRLNFPVDTIRQILKEALNSNRQLMLHVVGDSATKVVVNLMKNLATPEIWRTKRVRIEHGVGITPPVWSTTVNLGTTQGF